MKENKKQTYTQMDRETHKEKEQTRAVNSFQSVKNQKHPLAKPLGPLFNMIQPPGYRWASHLTPKRASHLWKPA